MSLSFFIQSDFRLTAQSESRAGSKALNDVTILYIDMFLKFKRKPEIPEETHKYNLRSGLKCNYEITKMN